MTETTLAVKVVSAFSNLVGNRPLEEAMQAEFDRLGPPEFDEADRAYAAAIRGTLDQGDIRAAFRSAGLPFDPSMDLCDTIVPLDAPRKPAVGSTDVGDVSWVVPTVQAHGATCATGTPFHSWQLTAQGQSPHAHKGMVHAAKVMAATATAALENPEIIARAKADLARRLEGQRYESPIPAEIPPPLDMAKG